MIRYYGAVCLVFLLLAGCGITRSLLSPETTGMYDDELEVRLIEENLTLRLGMERSEIIRRFGGDLKAGSSGDGISSYPFSFCYDEGRVSAIILGNEEKKPKDYYATSRGIGYGDSFEKVKNAYKAERQFMVENGRMIRFIYDIRKKAVTSDKAVEAESLEYLEGGTYDAAYETRLREWIYIVYIFDEENRLKLFAVGDGPSLGFLEI
ncbi:MAG: hypothetical protein JW881_16045 [Spirochaetales bacterium]|nr:hypothetical protein [Spirochaetales bacterium]